MINTKIEPTPASSPLAKVQETDADVVEDIKTEHSQITAAFAPDALRGRRGIVHILELRQLHGIEQRMHQFEAQLQQQHDRADQRNKEQRRGESPWRAIANAPAAESRRQKNR